MIRARIRPVVLGLAATACAAGAGPEDADRAIRAALVPAPFDVVRVDTLESLPPQFELVLRREVPTAGWGHDVLPVRAAPEGGRIRVDVVEVPPEGPVAQVITPVELRVALGPLPVGRHVVELWLRTGEDGEAVFAQAAIVAAYDR